MSKAELLNELSNNTFVMLKPSPLEGVGVFAIRDIAKGCRDMFSKPDTDEEWLTVSKKEIEQLPQHAQFVVGNYCLYDDENYFIPAKGFKKIDISLFLNHSDMPNIVSINDGDYFEAIRDIKAGEELVIDYGEIVTDSE
ncbi:MAG: SET domain-containing protein [Chitinophagaceae bacterium]|nr:SET domain-containing protein [Chitinophagaceae bacterium]